VRGKRKAETPHTPYPNISIDPFKKVGPFLKVSSGGESYYYVMKVKLKIVWR
jgi:hypothetical protein